MAEPDKIRKIAERLVWAGGSPEVEKERIERILREELEGLMVAAESAATGFINYHSRGDGSGYDAMGDAAMRLNRQLAAYGWPWRK